MKTILLTVLLACALFAGACSRSDQPEASAAKPSPNLKADAERLQAATQKAAEERKRAQPPESPTPAAPQP